MTILANAVAKIPSNKLSLINGPLIYILVAPRSFIIDISSFLSAILKEIVAISTIIDISMRYIKKNKAILRIFEVRFKRLSIMSF